MTTPQLDPHWLAAYPAELLQGLAWLLEAGAGELYASGGVVRDWLRGLAANDLDLALPAQAMLWAQRLATRLGGSYVPLDEREDVARVVWREFVLDFSGFREGSQSIGADLGKRDFTINAMAIRLLPREGTLQLSTSLLDPLGGYQDLLAKRLRPTSPTIFRSDPLRVLRAYRFLAQGGFLFTPELAELLRGAAALLAGVAVERIASELELILAAESAPPVLARMGADGLWPFLFPELAASPSLALLRNLRAIAQGPGEYLRAPAGPMRCYLEEGLARSGLRWAALLHGLGRDSFLALARRLRWSRQRTRQVGILLEWREWPAVVHSRELSEEELLLAVFKLVQAAGGEWPGVFLLAMAAALPPPSWLAALGERVAGLVATRILPLLAAPPLLSGHDLQARFSLPAGPMIGKLLARLEEARLLHPNLSVAEAEALVATILSGETI